MRCAIKIDKNIALADQEVKAWGEMQSLEEEPVYKESDIEEEKDKKFFFGYKCSMDDTWAELDNLVFDEEITEEQASKVKERMKGSLCKVLFELLDSQVLKDFDDIDDIEEDDEQTKSEVGYKEI